MFESFFGGASSKEVDAITARICLLFDLLEPLLDKDYIKEVKPALDKAFQSYGELWNDTVEDCIQIGILADQPSYMLRMAEEDPSRKLPTIRVTSFMIMGHDKLSTLFISGSVNDNRAGWSVEATDKMMAKATKLSKLVAQELLKMPGWRATKMFDFVVISRI